MPIANRFCNSMLFHLPADVRIIIWRKVRYFVARDNLASRIVFHDCVNSTRAIIGSHDTLCVCINIPHNKSMHIIKNPKLHYDPSDSLSRFRDSYYVLNNTCQLDLSAVVSVWYDPFETGWVKLK